MFWNELEGYPGSQLAIVRYASDHAPFDDWVYNAANIDKSKVVWAREAETRIVSTFYGISVTGKLGSWNRILIRQESGPIGSGS